MGEVHYAPSRTAAQVLRARYLLKDDRGEPVETPEGMFRRVARHVAAAERVFDPDADVAAVEERFFEAMSRLDFLPNSPTLMNAATDVGQLAACFVLPLGDSLEEIFETAKRAALVFKSGGGVGISFSRLRPRGDAVLSTKGVASGPVSFMHIFDTGAEVVKQGGRRRGAMMGALRVDHPDVLEFVRCKREPGRLSSFNTSVAVTDAFMEAAEASAEYDLVNPRTGLPTGRKRAREVLDEIVRCARATGEPGVLFIDRMNASNPTPDLGSFETTNPCVTGDTWVMTQAGPRQVRDLIYGPVSLFLDGKLVQTDGFVSSGKKQVYRVRTHVGLEVRATAEHEFVRYLPDMTGTEKVPLTAVNVGDMLPIHVPDVPHEWEVPDEPDDIVAYQMGLWFGDGTTTNGRFVGQLNKKTAGVEGILHYLGRTHGVAVRDAGVNWSLGFDESPHPICTDFLRYGVRKRKVITRRMEEAPPRFYRHFLRGFFDTDGSVMGTREKGHSVRFSQSDLPRIQAVQRMLLRLGIFSTMRLAHPAGEREMPDGNGGMKAYHCRDNYELIITSQSLVRFHEAISFHNAKKYKRLCDAVNSYERGPYAKAHVARVVSVEPEAIEDVYDVHVPGVNVFDANGIVVGNCGETQLLPYESCNLASINLARIVVGGEVDERRLSRATRIATRFLDNVVEVNRHPLPEIAEVTNANRKIGLGVMGFAEMLIRLGVPYDSEPALEVAGRVMRVIDEASLEESRRLAEARGPFPNFEESALKEEPRVRNATRTAVAPTGTISIIAGVTGGIEPVFAVGLHRRNILDGSEFFELHPLFEEFARREGFYSEDLVRRVSGAASVADMEEIPPHVRRLFRTAHDVAPERHVGMQAAFQRHVDNSVSKTVNLPADATEDDVRKVFLLAYESGCKGITVYRDGSRDRQPLSSGKPEETRPREPRPRPDVLPGRTRKLKTGCGNIFVTITTDESGRPLELFAKHGKAGVCSQAQCEAIGRLASLALRSDVDPKQIEKQLAGITCHAPFGFGPEKVLSCADAIARAVRLEIAEEQGPGARTDTTPPVLRTGACPECGAALTREGHCASCHSCGYTQCG
jgi:ribonucleoside-diphosphate reductase alpha chain